MSRKTGTHHGITFDGKELEAFCRKNGIKKLSLFGSVLRDDFSPESDIDMLVEFMPGEVVGFFRLIETEEELCRMLGGRKVDLRTHQELSRYFRDSVIAEEPTCSYQRYQADLTVESDHSFDLQTRDYLLEYLDTSYRLLGPKL